MTADVVVNHLNMKYRDNPVVLSDVSLHVHAGQIVSLVGENGAGKSTLLRSLVRLREPTSGSVTIGSVEVTAIGRRKLRALRTRVGFIFQTFSLVERESAFRNVMNGALGRSWRAMIPALAPAELREEVMECLERVGLAEFADRRVDTLSGGQRQRVAIARSLMQHPDLILADEPVSSLDPSAGSSVMQLLREVAREDGITVIAVLHQLDFALEYSDRIIGLKQGQVVVDTTTDQLNIESLRHLYQQGDSETEATRAGNNQDLVLSGNGTTS